MIDVFQASSELLEQIQQAANEREVITLVSNALYAYQYATRVKHSELDIAFAATGGPTQWVNVDNISISFAPKPKRASQYGDIFVEQAYGYVNLSTPAGFIPLIDVIERQGCLVSKLAD